MKSQCEWCDEPAVLFRLTVSRQDGTLLSEQLICRDCLPREVKGDVPKVEELYDEPQEDEP